MVGRITRRFLIVGLVTVMVGQIGFAVADRLEPHGQVSEGHMVYGGRDRIYLVFTPPGLTRGLPSGLVVGLHGYTGTASDFEGYSGLDAEAGHLRLINVFPQGIGRSWNAGVCCGEAAHAGIDDVGFIAALVGLLEAEY